MKRYLIPLGIFLAVVVFLARGLSLDPKEVPSPLIGKPAPAFAVPSLAAPERTLRRDDLLGKTYVLNVWASWCGACRDEHPVLVEMAARNVVPLYGLNYKDTRADGLGWLTRFQNPYADSLFDPDGRVGLDYGVYGVPETFVIDRAGIIRYKHIGPLTREIVAQKIEPLVRSLQ
jgi:cytochrome c biogenesis protein CcmG, thiol:disulfide interchange protein DsbE